jgi:hypothetical protein
MVEFAARLSEGWKFVEDHTTLAVVPFLSTFLGVSEMVRVLSFRGSHVGITFPFPAALVDLWTFVSVPNTGGIDGGAAFVVVATVLPIKAGLVAGYLGSIAEEFEVGRHDFSTNVTRYFLPMLGYVAVVLLFGSGSILPVLFAGPPGAGGVAIVLFALVLLVSYLFYATPYLVVLRDDGLVEAIRGSYAYAIKGEEYAAFGITYLLTATVLSTVGTTLTVNFGAVGILLGAVLAAPVGLAFNAAVMSFVRHLEEERATSR